jgi:hypothetical protein
LGKDYGQSLSATSFDVVNSYLFSPYVSVGLGLGGQLSAGRSEMIWAYADSRIYFMRANVGPYVDLSVGYAGMFFKYTDYDTFSLHLPTIWEQDHGLTGSASLGIRVALGKKVAINAGLGYKMYYLFAQNDSYYQLSNDATFRPDKNGAYLFNALIIKAGVQF